MRHETLQHGNPCAPAAARSRSLWWLPVLATLAFAVRPGAGQEPDISVADLGLVSGFQDYWDNHYRRGRSIVADDFDGDGRLDYFIGNPGDESFVLRNLGPGTDGEVRFAPAQVLLRGALAWAASAADYDNDGDVDLFVACGGLDGACLDFLFRNDSVPGTIRFQDVSAAAGIQGPMRVGGPASYPSGGGTWGDYDRDGDPDLFVSVWGTFWDEVYPYPGTLWRNRGDGTFADVTAGAGLSGANPGQKIRDFQNYQNSTWIDADNDGDLDLFANNAAGLNCLWRNLLSEWRLPVFEDATAAFSLPGQDLRFPYYSFASAVADFDNNGWQDLMLFALDAEPRVSPYGNGNGLFLNRNGKGFVNAAARAGINVPGGGPEVSMGCQVVDLNADGIPDLAVGAGDPGAGARARLLLSLGPGNDGVPRYRDASSLIDFEPSHGIDPSSPPYPEIPPYPYRGHGIAAGDVDGDGVLELAMVNGGPARDPAIVREPDRLFRFAGPGIGNTFRAHLRGNGVTDGRDGIGARAYVTIPDAAGTRRVFQTVLGQSGFSAQNERTLTFGLGSERSVARLAILWPSGCLQVLESPSGSPSPLVVDEACWTCAGAPGPVQGWLDPDRFECARPPVCRIEGGVSDTLGPVPWTRVIENHADPPVPVEARSGADGLFALEHPYEPGECRVTVVEPFGYLPASSPINVDDEPGTRALSIDLVRGPEGRSPRGAGFWRHQMKALAPGGRSAQESAEEMAAWSQAIRLRYPGLSGFDSFQTLDEALTGPASRSAGGRLRRHLAATLLNLASGRLSSYTVLASGDRLGDVVEEAYQWLGKPDADPVGAARLADVLEALNEGLMFP